MSAKPKKNGSCRSKQGAVKTPNDKTPNDISKAREREYFELSTSLLSKLKVLEQQAFDRYQISQQNDDANVWLTAAHQLRMVARDIKFGGIRMDQEEAQ
jgi:hypothetical protein